MIVSTTLYVLSGIFSTLVISLVLKKCCTDRIKRCWEGFIGCCHTPSAADGGSVAHGSNSSNQASTPNSTNGNALTSTASASVNIQNPPLPKDVKNLATPTDGEKKTPTSENSDKNETDIPEQQTEGKEPWVTFTDEDDDGEVWEEGFWDSIKARYWTNDDIEVYDIRGKTYPLRYCGPEPAWTSDGIRMTLGYKYRAMEYVMRKQALKKEPVLKTKERIRYKNMVKIIEIERPNQFLDSTKFVRYEDLMACNPLSIRSYMIPNPTPRHEAGNFQPCYFFFIPA